MKKRKVKVFELPYIGCEQVRSYTVIYGVKGNPIITIKVDNPVLEMCADSDLYADAQELFTKVVKILGDGMIIQKTDVIYQKPYNPDPEEDYLLKAYQEHFRGRIQKSLSTYISITPSFIETKKISKYSKKSDTALFNKIDKIVQIFAEAGMNPTSLTQYEIEHHIKRFLTFNFDQNSAPSQDNILSYDTHLQVGEKFVKCVTLVDTEIMGIPSLISPIAVEGGKELNELLAYPVDNMKVLFDNDDYEALLYNQVVEVCKQTKTIAELGVKKRRSISVKDPSNDLAVEDIDSMLSDIARDNQLITKAHFNIVLGCDSMTKLNKCVNFYESAFLSKGFIVGKNTFNQMELFRSCLFGNANELNTNDMFLTSADAAICFFFKERKLVDEKSDFYLYYTDRQGIPLKIDTEDLPYTTGRIVNRNKFVLGPSGSGKSFMMNSFLAQMLRYNTDVVIIDTGDSYLGTCEFFGGKYITYKEDKPITMNPFKISQEERNLEKSDFLTMLILLIYKETGDNVNKGEEELISRTIEEYYKRYFDHKNDWYKEKSIQELEDYVKQLGFDVFGMEEKKTKEIKKLHSGNILEYYTVLELPDSCSIEDIKTSYRSKAKKYHPDNEGGNAEMFKIVHEAYKGLITIHSSKISEEEKKQELIKVVEFIDEQLKVENLSFNTFYEFSIQYIGMLQRGKNISQHFDLEKYSFVLEKFYKGGRFETILNENSDSSLLEEKFIVFEIDNVKDNKDLFPIVTLVIMDVFLQKMRTRSDQRKALIIEEAWKAIASPLMSNYIVYLYKTVRKFWGECIVVTQELNDIIDNPVVKDSIIANSDSLILLDQSKFKNNFDKVAKLLSLDPIEQSKIFTINNLENKKNRGFFKEFYLKRGLTGEVYGNEVSLTQYLAFTTEKPEKNAVLIYKKRYKNYENAVSNLIKDMEETNLPLPKMVKLINALSDVPTEEIKNSAKKNYNQTITNLNKMKV